MTIRTRAERIQRAILALHDYGTRDGATPETVKAAMVKDGFTKEEMAQAAAEMLGDDE